LLLLFIKKIWVAVLAAVLGAALGGGIYLFHNVVLSANREYRATSKLYLYFAPDEKGVAYEAYNGYTWNDLMSTERILNGTMLYLPDTYTEEEVVEATTASILSDIRILTITITTSDPNKTSEILEATNKSLVEMGEREIEFTEIEVIEETEAKLVTADSRMIQAVLTGLVIVLILSLIAMALVYVLDDRIYVPGDLKCVTGLPFIGFLFTDKIEKGKNSGEEALVDKLHEDMELNRVHLMKENGTLDTLELSKKSQVTEEVCDKLRKANGVILVIPYGKMDRTSLAYRIDQLALQECKTVGIIIKDADMRFMKWYYNHL
ncbi:MAG: hypothetical protein K2N85_01390, partial [Lachnospiraceae bacterium]|nr:hypothetical protein [Lachnospiraceae bacterium]